MATPEQRAPDEEPPIESPPEGAVCAEHSDRPALAVCPRCGSYACLACWHHAVRRCHACLMQDPAAAAPPIPWEDPRANVVVRFVGTLASALRPTGSAPAFARDDIARARTFWAISFLPLALLAGVSPYTTTLFFGWSRVIVLGHPDEAAIALDVVRATGIGLAVSLVTLLALALPFVSLARSYADKGYRDAPLRAVLYRAFLLPLSELLFGLAAFALPGEPSDVGVMMLAAARVLPLALLFWSLRATARMASGAGPVASYVAVIVPFAVMVMAQQFVARAIAPWMPDEQEVRAALEAAGVM